MDAKVETACREVLAALKDLHDVGAIDDPTYYKGIVAIAYEYATDDDLGAAVGLLLKAPASYYLNDQAKQLAEDPDYAEVCRVLVKKLVMGGYLDDRLPLAGVARA